MCQYRQHFQKCRSSSIITNFITRSENCWLRVLWVFLMSTLRSPITMGYWSWKSFRACSKSIKCSRVEGGWYAPIIRVRLPSVTTLQLTMHVLWKHVASTIQSWGQSRTIRPTPPTCRLSPPWSLAITPYFIPAYCDNNSGHWFRSPSVSSVRSRQSIPPRGPEQYWSLGRCGCWESQGIVPGIATSVSAVEVYNLKNIVFYYRRRAYN